MAFADILRKSPLLGRLGGGKPAEKTEKADSIGGKIDWAQKAREIFAFIQKKAESVEELIVSARESRKVFWVGIVLFLVVALLGGVGKGILTTRLSDFLTPDVMGKWYLDTLMWHISNFERLLHMGTFLFLLAMDTSPGKSRVREIIADVCGMSIVYHLAFIGNLGAYALDTLGYFKITPEELLQARPHAVGQILVHVISVVVAGFVFYKLTRSDKADQSKDEDE